MSAPVGPPRRILVVDDEPFVCDAVKMMLMFDGHIVETANNGKEALDIFSTGKFDLVITDFAMPSMKGDELAAQIKARVRAACGDDHRIRGNAPIFRNANECCGLYN